mmetsp:Transcript_35515/g.90106  ORF Transcript_35515/g.90106 Transcript_35515/m.90106 type:complete len:656 (+) Transcript_35515:738-2705(+)
MAARDGAHGRAARGGHAPRPLPAPLVLPQRRGARARVLRRPHAAPQPRVVALHAAHVAAGAAGQPARDRVGAAQEQGRQGALLPAGGRRVRAQHAARRPVLLSRRDGAHAARGGAGDGRGADAELRLERRLPHQPRRGLPAAVRPTRRARLAPREQDRPVVHALQAPDRPRPGDAPLGHRGGRRLLARAGRRQAARGVRGALRRGGHAARAAGRRAARSLGLFRHDLRVLLPHDAPAARGPAHLLLGARADAAARAPLEDGARHGAGRADAHAPGGDGQPAAGAPGGAAAGAGGQVQGGGRGQQAQHARLPRAGGLAHAALLGAALLPARRALARAVRQPNGRRAAAAGGGAQDLLRAARVLHGRHRAVLQAAAAHRARLPRDGRHRRAARLPHAHGHLHRRAALRQEPVPARHLHQDAPLPRAGHRGEPHLGPRLGAALRRLPHAPARAPPPRAARDAVLRRHRVHRGRGRLRLREVRVPARDGADPRVPVGSAGLPRDDARLRARRAALRALRQHADQRLDLRHGRGALQAQGHPRHAERDGRRGGVGAAARPAAAAAAAAAEPEREHRALLHAVHQRGAAHAELPLRREGRGRRLHVARAGRPRRKHAQLLPQPARRAQEHRPQGEGPRQVLLPSEAAAVRDRHHVHALRAL